MEERERLRHRLSGQIGQLLKNRSFRAALPPLRDGEAPFVVGLPDDTMGYLARRVATLGGQAHLLVITPLTDPPMTRVRVLLIQECEHKDVKDLDDDRECAVNENTTLGMLMEAIEVGDKRVYYTYDSETIIRFINDSVQPVVPA